MMKIYTVCWFKDNQRFERPFYDELDAIVFSRKTYASWIEEDWLEPNVSY